MTGMRSPEEVHALATAAGFGEIAGELVRLARPALILDEAAAGSVAGSLGGAPRLPPGEPWPQTRWEGMEPEPLAFFAELDLGALDGAVWPGPASGTLSVFCHVVADAMYVDSGGAVRVLHHPAGTPLERREPPEDLDEDLLFDELSVAATAVTTLPWIGVGPARELIPFGLDALDDLDRAQAYVDLAREVRGPTKRGTPHQLLGWPQFTQDDVTYTWATLHDEAVDHGTVAERVAMDDVWRLLLQIGADGRLGTSFGDGGDLFFGIPESDVAAGRFDRVEAITDSS